MKGDKTQSNDRRMWTKKHRQFVGRIIISKFLELSPEKFKSYVDDVEKSPLFIKLSGRGIIKIMVLSGVFAGKSGINSSKKAISRIRTNGKDLTINYTRKVFLKKYLIDSKKLSEFKMDGEGRINSLLYNLKRITSRNEDTHKILSGILEYQKSYFLTGNFLELRPLTQMDFARAEDMDASRLSRAIKGKTIITPQGREVPIKLFFHKKKELKKRLVNEIISSERAGLKSESSGCVSRDEDFRSGAGTSGRVRRLYSDSEIMNWIKNGYGISVPIRTVASYRKELGIPSFWGRVNCEYSQLRENFTNLYPYTLSSVNSNTVESSGIYEIRLSKGVSEYNNRGTGIFYIGSAQNIKKRLKEHFKSRNGEMKEILKKHKCLFRYVIFQKDWKKEEKRLYNLFLSTYGAPPKYNKVSP